MPVAPVLVKDELVEAVEVEDFVKRNPGDFTNGIIGTIQQGKKDQENAAGSSSVKDTTKTTSTPPKSDPTPSSGDTGNNSNTGGNSGGSNSGGNTNTGSGDTSSNNNNNNSSNNNNSNNSETSNSNNSNGSGTNGDSGTSNQASPSTTTPNNAATSLPPSNSATSAISQALSSLSVQTQSPLSTSSSVEVPGSTPVSGQLLSSSSGVGSGVGAGVGATVAVLAIIAVLLCCRRRRQRRRASQLGSFQERGATPSEKSSSKLSAARSFFGLRGGRTGGGSLTSADRQSTHSSFASPLAPNRPESNYSIERDPFADSAVLSEKNDAVDAEGEVSRANSVYEQSAMTMSPMTFAPESIASVGTTTWLHRHLSHQGKESPAIPPVVATKLNRSSTIRTVSSVGKDSVISEDGTYIVQRPFSPTLADEMAVTAGDQVKIVRSFDDGWAFCIKSDETARGLIPLTALSVSSGSGTGSSSASGSSQKRSSVSSMASTLSRTSSLSHQIEDLISAGGLKSFV